MANKNWLISIVILALSAGMVFANGSVDDRGNVVPGSGRYYEPATETFEGRFSLVDNLYPALVTDAGETYYLMVHAPLDESSIPEEGAELTIEAVRSPMSPVNLMVFSAVVDGEELEFDAPFRGGPGGMMGGYGGAGPRGMMGGYGYGGPGVRGRGNRGRGCYGYDEGGWGNDNSNGWRR